MFLNSKLFLSLDPRNYDNVYGNMHPRLTGKKICIQHYIKYQAPMEFLPAINLAMESIISQIVQLLQYLEQYLPSQSENFKMQGIILLIMVRDSSQQITRNKGDKCKQSIRPDNQVTYQPPDRNRLF